MKRRQRFSTLLTNNENKNIANCFVPAQNLSGKDSKQKVSDTLRVFGKDASNLQSYKQKSQSNC
jgi:hypothetical protein